MRGFLTAAGGGALALALARLRRRNSGIDLAGRVVLVTGGSRGLGLAMAREFRDQGAILAVCARDAQDVEAAAAELRADGGQAIGIPCDVTNPGQVQQMIDRIVATYGRLDVLVNNAGAITIGPVETQTYEDYRQAMNVMFWGIYHSTMAALPHLGYAGGGRIVNITSIGGKVPAPHLLPYTTAKHAAVGFSEGLRVELSGNDDGVLVTTVVPGLMRTGSHVNALAKGKSAAEYSWFGLSATLPFTSTSAEHAARRIVAATRRGDAEAILTWQAQLATRMHGLAPGLTTRAAGLFQRLLPSAPDEPEGLEPQLGRETGAGLGPMETLSAKVAAEHRQHPG